MLLQKYVRGEAGIEPGTVAAMRAAVSPDTLRRIERARATEWLPLAWEIALLRAVHARGGDEAVRAVAVAVGRAARRLPVFQPLFDAMIGMLGRHREILVRFLVASLDLSMRNAGRRGAITGEGRVIRIVLEEIPAASWDRVVNLRNCGAIESLDVNGISPRAEAEWVEGSTRVVYTLTWP